MKKDPFIIERTFDAPVERVWDAISKNEQMKGWYFDLEEFRAEPGFKFRFSGGSETATYLHLCGVTEVLPAKKLSYSWRYDGYPGSSLLTFELFPAGENQTRLKLTHSGLDTFPQDTKDFSRESFSAGWHEIIGTHLKSFVEDKS